MNKGSKTEYVKKAGTGNNDVGDANKYAGRFDDPRYYSGDTSS